MKLDFASSEVTVACLCWLRFGRQLPYIATEYETYGYHRADVFGANEKESVEIEVKVSRSDLLRDFASKKSKHQRYGDAFTVSSGARMPNRVYFAVPERIKDDALKTISREAPAYGIIVMAPSTEAGWLSSVPWKLLRVARSAKWPHNDPPAKSLIADVTQRMASEIAILHIAGLRWGGFLGHVKAEIERHHSARPIMPGEIDDPALEDLLPKEIEA